MRELSIWPRLMRGVRSGLKMAVLLVSVARCQSAELEANACVPGVVRSCLGLAGCLGSQICQLEGDRFDECACLPVASDAGPATTGQEIEILPPPVTESLKSTDVAAACAVDSDCGPALFCIGAAATRSFFGSGVAGGYCTASCQDDAECEELDSESRCVEAPNGQARVCMRTCLSLRPDPGERKCLDRPNLVCASAAASGSKPFRAQRQAGVCIPVCTSDAECPGRHCDPASGLCVDEPRGGLPLGSECQDAAECQGAHCESIGRSFGLCTQFCKSGGYAGCGFSGSGPKRGAACLAPYVRASRFTEGEGDLGLCRELCDSDVDCESAAQGWACRSSELVATRFGRAGTCAPPPLAPAPEPGGAADAGVSGDAGGATLGSRSDAGPAAP